jgi:hypothetical protein
MTSTSGGTEIVYTTDDNGKEIPLVYDTKYIDGVKGTYEGDFEIFRDLYYVLITRKLALYAELDESETVRGQDVVAKLSITTSLKDHPISYYKYDSNGQKMGSYLRDEGGNILCYNVTIPSTEENGSPVVYEKAFYDIKKKRFFLKSEDPNDGNVKPNGFENKGDGTVAVNLYLPATAEGEYVETTYTYEFYDLYDNNGQLNPTYMYIIPTIVTKTYKLNANGERELISQDSDRASEDAGVYIRTATINKLFSDTHKLLRGEQIDKMGVN